jgi:hypothetical protein
MEKSLKFALQIEAKPLIQRSLTLTPLDLLECITWAEDA